MRKCGSIIVLVGADLPPIANLATETTRGDVDDETANWDD
jgi:hypothetical protein